MKSFKVKYISDKKSIFFKKGDIYEAFLPLDNQSGNVFCFYLDDYDESGYYALPSSRFEIVRQAEMFEYNIYPENSPEKFREVCGIISKNLKSAERKKLLIDVDGSTVQKFLIDGKSIVVYDDYDVGAVFVKSEIPLKFL